ncbi:MAG: AMP-binding protein, partial [Deltaproteobacteria bacterium]|nr:AMP-binding protein [Deltaproteobacteria bacterium]
MGVHDYTIYDFISRNAQLHPDLDCIVFGEVRLSHKEYKEKCDRLAAGLVKSGINIGDRLGVLAHNSDEFMILYGAAARIGAILLPVNWRFQQNEVEYVLNDCTPRVIFASKDYQETIAEAARNVNSVERRYTMGGGDVPEGFLPFEELYSDEELEEEPDVPADSGFVIIHTAAVEGHPRGALLSQANLVFANILMAGEYGLGTDACYMAVMHAGGKNAILERFDAELACQLIDREKGTVLFNFAPILKMIMDKYEEGSYDFSNLRHVTGLDHPDNIKRFLQMIPGVTYWTGFGQTEAMSVSACPLDEKPGSAGKPSPLARVALFDDYDNEVPVGTPGEICVRSPVVFLGYWGRDEDNAFTFRNGWHHTGDVGRFDEQGYLWYVKRKAQ